MMIYWAGLLSILIAIESVFLGTCYYLLNPPQPSPIAQDFFATYQHAIVPKHDVFFLRLFILVGIVSFILLMRFCARLTSQRLISFKYFTMIQAVILAIETFFLFKYAVYRYPLWLNGFYVSLIVSACLKIFTPEVIKFLRFCDERMKDKKPFAHLSPWLIAAGALLIPLIIWVPDVEGVVARMYFGEQFHHMDWLLMPAGWAHLSGNILGVDNISRYGLGAPILVSEIAQRLLGHFDCVNAVIVMMMVSVIYYWIWFYALKLVFKDSAWAFIAIFLGIRLHFFNTETFPFIFTYPQDTPLRYFCDSLFFLFLIIHTQTGRIVWLYLASALCGFAVFHITGEGLYTLATFYVSLILREVYIRINPNLLMSRLTVRQWINLGVIPWMVLLFCLWLVAGKHIFEGIFWSNQFEFIRFYQSGNQSELMINNLKDPYILQASIAFLLPVVYLFALIVFLGRLMQKSLKADGLIMACASVFLLISYHYHATVSNNMPAYLRNGVVIAMGAVFILKELTDRLDKYNQRLCKLACGIAVFVMMVTTHQFLLHPNIFNLSRNPITHPVVSEVPYGRKSYFNHLFISYPDAFKLPVNGLGEKDEMMLTENDFADDNQLKEFYRKESDYSKDAALIQSLTAPNQKVPLVSTFENLILMQAKRRPFFYTYFFVNSEPRRIRRFPFTILYTKSNLLREIKRLDTLKPPYIFIEKTYLVSPIPRAYLYDSEDLIDMLGYIFRYYAPYRSGEFLEALKRSSSRTLTDVRK